MNEHELLALLKAERDKVTLTVPVEEIISRGRAVRGRAVRSRRRLPGVAAALVVVAGTVLAVTAVLPSDGPGLVGSAGRGNHPPGAPTSARLAAWTVTKQADGNISITFRELRDAAGLQSRLRAEGVPASVTFQQLNPSCQHYPAGAALLRQVFPGPNDIPSPPPGGRHMTRVAPGSAPPSPSVRIPGADSTVIVIDPADLPSHTGVQLASSATSVAILLPRLVYASASCTGS